MFTLNSTTTTSDTIPFPGGDGVMVWDGISSAQTGTLILERQSTDPGSTWTPVGVSGTQLTAAGTLLFTETKCLLRLRVTSPSGDILCEAKRCHAGRLVQD